MVFVRTIGHYRAAVGPHIGPKRGTVRQAWIALIYGELFIERCRCGTLVVYLRRRQLKRVPSWEAGDWGCFEIEPRDRQWFIARPGREEHGCKGGEE